MQYSYKYAYNWIYDDLLNRISSRIPLYFKGHCNYVTIALSIWLTHKFNNTTEKKLPKGNPKDWHIKFLEWNWRLAAKIEYASPIHPVLTETN